MPYHHILVPLDGSLTAKAGLQEALKLAHGQAATLHLLHVMDDSPLMAEMSAASAYEQWHQRSLEFADALLARAQAQVREAGLEARLLRLEAGGRRVADVVVDEALRARCDLIVMGSHGRRGVSRALLGSEAEAVARLAPMPVLLVKGETHPRPA